MYKTQAYSKVSCKLFIFVLFVFQVGNLYGTTSSLYSLILLDEALTFQITESETTGALYHRVTGEYFFDLNNRVLRWIM